MPIFQQGGWFDPYSGSHLRSFAGDRRPRPEPRADRAVVARGGGRDLPRRRRPLRRRSTVIRDHELAFYDRFLRDEANGWDERPPAELYVLGAERVARRAASGRSRGRDFTPFHLRGGAGGSARRSRGRTSRPTATTTTPPTRPDDRRRQLGADDDAGRRDADPRRGRSTSACSRRATTCSSTRATRSTADLEVIGPVEMTLYAASSARDTDFIVRLCDVYPDGRSIFLTEGIIRARYRESVRGRVASSCSSRARSPSTGSASTPWRTCFAAGHRIRLDVTSSSFPRFSRQPQHRRGRRHRHPDGGRAPDRPPHRRVPVARAASRRPVNGPFDLTGPDRARDRLARGLGLAMARALADAGARVAINGRTAEACEAALWDGAVAAPFDVTDEAAVADGRRAARAASTCSSTTPASSSAARSTRSSPTSGTVFSRRT